MHTWKNSSKLRKFFIDHGKKHLYKKGLVVVSALTPVPGIYYITHGCIAVRSAKKGEQKLYALYKEGEMFPLLWALQGVQKQYSYEAYTDCEVILADKDQLNTAIATDIRVAQEVIMHLSAYCTMFLERIDHLEIPKAYDRVLRRLIFFSERFGLKKNDDIVIQIPLTHETIAESLSMSRETTSRIMKRLKNEGLIQYANHYITLKHKLLITSLFTSLFLNITPDFTAI